VRPSGAPEAGQIRVADLSVFAFASLGYGATEARNTQAATIPGSARIVGQEFGGAAFQLASR
jgi:hypothetical protein